MTNSDLNSEQFKKSLDVQDEQIIEFLPLLLKDLWELGGDSKGITKLLQRNNLLRDGLEVIDLGCGKGATVIELAKHCDGDFTGIDIVKEFIDEGRTRIEGGSLKGRVHLIAGDMLEALEKSNQYDIVIYGHDSDILGTESEALKVLNHIKKETGYIIFETAFGSQDCPDKDYPTYDQLENAIQKSGLTVVDKYLRDQASIIKINADYNHKIKKNVDALSLQYPDKKPLFDTYYQNQLDESYVLDHFASCISFLLK